MIRTWKKVKRSGTYYRIVKKERDAIFKRASEVSNELSEKRENFRGNAFCAQPAVIPETRQFSLINPHEEVVALNPHEPIALPINNNNNETTRDSIDYEDQDSGAIDSSTIVVDVETIGSQTSDDELWPEEETQVEKNARLRFNLRKWAVQHNITHMALKDLIKLINTDIGKILPADPRTLLQTPQETFIKEIGNGGQYWHHGFEKHIKSIFQSTDESKIISVNINLDGLPIFNSSKLEFWPILFNISEMPHLPAMVIGIYCGVGKCSDLEAFLTPFVEEMKEAMMNGIYVNAHQITVLIRCIVCDSPARAYVKGVANFNAHHGCQKCTTVGEFSYVSNTNVFPRTNCEKRTDDNFRKRLYGTHHKYDSPLLKLEIDMVDQFPVGDSLHLLHLGIMKRLLFGWRDGTFRQSNTKWRAQTTSEVSDFLLQCKMPAEFHRVVRGLDCLTHWKGTEYRTFLHYIGIGALKDHLTHEAYDHFLLLFCAVTICSSKTYFKILPVARGMLLQFVEIFSELYGVHHLTSNVHNLTHLVDEVERFGELESFSTYPFESALGRIKRLLRNGTRPLAQVVKRINEDFSCDLISTHRKSSVGVQKENILSKENKGNNIPNLFKSSVELEYKFFYKVQLDQFCLSADQANCWFLTKQNEIGCLKNIIKSTKQSELELYSIEIDEKANFFIIPLESRHLDIYCADRYAYLKKKERKIFKLSNVKCKLVRLPYRQMQIFIPLLHTIPI